MHDSKVEQEIGDGVEIVVSGFFFQREGGIRDFCLSRGLGDVYKGKLISVSGESLSVVNAAKKAKDLGLKVVTFSGRHESNALKKLGDINFWVDSHAYNIVECIHMIWLTSVIDAVIGKAEYEVS